MGCDIHWELEHKIGDTWHTIPLSEPDMPKGDCYDDEEAWNTYWRHPAIINRNYGVFSVLADVRNHRGVTPISRYRGIPKDSPLFSYFEDHKEEFAGYLHSHTWVTMDEFEDLTVEQEEAAEEFIKRNLPYFKSFDRDSSKIRLVMWFDN